MLYVENLEVGTSHNLTVVDHNINKYLSIISTVRINPRTMVTVRVVALLQLLFASPEANGAGCLCSREKIINTVDCI